MEDEPNLDALPWWRPAARQASRYLLLTAFGTVVVVALQAKLLEWLWLDEAALLAHLRYLALEIHLGTIVMSWFATLAALAFSLWVFERACRRELSRVRDEGAEFLTLLWEEELKRRSAEIRSGEEPGVPADEVLAGLRAQLPDPRDEEESQDAEKA